MIKSDNFGLRSPRCTDVTECIHFVLDTHAKGDIIIMLCEKSRHLAFVVFSSSTPTCYCAVHVLCGKEERGVISDIFIDASLRTVMQEDDTLLEVRAPEHGRTSYAGRPPRDTQRRT